MFITNRKTFVYGLCGILLLNVLVPAQANPFFLVGLFQAVLGVIVKIIESSEVSSVIVENHGRHHAHLWCASRDDRIGGVEGIWVPPGQSLGWTFHKISTTQFWCTMDWFGRRYGWDVFVTNWGGNHGRWHIRDDGIYEGGGAKRMPIESNIPVGLNKTTLMQTTAIP